MNARPTIALLTVALAGAACKSNTFSGSTTKPKPPVAATNNGQKSQPQQQPQQQGRGPSTDGSARGGNGGNGGGLPNLAGTLGNLAQIAAGLGQVLGNVQTQNPTPNSISFGGQQAFHIGDGYITGTSCTSGVNTYPLVGTSYFFQFRVNGDNASVRAALNGVCGVDFPDTNHFSIIAADGTRVRTMLLSPGQGYATIGADNLPAGYYEVLVESLTGSKAAPAEKPDDADDFIVGSVTVSASVPIDAGQAGTH